MSDCTKCKNQVRKHGFQCSRCKRYWHPHCVPGGRRGKHHVNSSWLCADCNFNQEETGLDQVIEYPVEYAASPSPPPNQFAELANPDNIVLKYNELVQKTEDLDKEVGSLKRTNEYQKALVRKLHITMAKQEQSLKNRNLEIHNVDKRPKENLVEIVLVLSSLLGVPLDADELEKVERLPCSRPYREPAILVVFRDVNKRNLFFSKRKSADVTAYQLVENGSYENVVHINHNLTSYFRRLLFFTQRAAPRPKYLFVWYCNGKVLVRKAGCEKVISIESPEDLYKISNEVNFTDFYNPPPGRLPNRGTNWTTVRHRSHERRQHSDKSRGSPGSKPW